ncbi:MAG: hypothetical protein ACXWFX_02600 [Methylobacter sp.]
MTTMKDAIVIINAGDIPAAEQTAKDLFSYTVYVFDPVLVDRVTSSSLQNIELISWDDCPLYHELDAAAHATAFELEAQLDLAVRSIVPDVSIASWQHLNLYYLFITLKWYSGLWEKLGEKLADSKVHVFICDTPATYYFNSFIPSLLLLCYLKGHDIEFSGYTYGELPDDTDLIPDLSGINSTNHQEQILIHFPTCMYDANYFYQEARATGKTLINIQAKHFDIPIPTHKTLPLVHAKEILASFPQSIREKISAFSEQLTTTLDSFLAPYIVIPNYRARQIQHISQLYCAQLITYFQLNSHFEHSKPSKILLSDHDAGFHGPIVSFAQKHSLPVLLLPHSKTSGDIEFRYRNIIALTHPMQAQEILDPNANRVLNLLIAYPETFVSSSEFTGNIRRISILLNAMSLNGIYFRRYETYFDGIRQIIDWCKKNNVEYKVRCKPSYSLIALLAEKVGIDAGELVQNITESMEEHVKDCGLCILYDTPTSGALYFLKNSIPILNPVVGSLTRAEMAIVNPDVILPESIETTLQRLNGFKADPVKLFTFRNMQFKNYIQQFQATRPLRIYL